MKTANFALALALCLLAIAPVLSAQDAPDPRAGVFGSDFPYESRFVEINDQQMHYIDEGQGQTFVFLHGNPTSSYLWRNVMPLVKPIGRVVAVDNIGFGKSAKPDLDYTFQTHYEYIESFIETLELENIILVIHDWGSVLGLDGPVGWQQRSSCSGRWAPPPFCS